MAARERLFAAGLLLPTGVDGVYGRSAEFERVVSAVDRLVHVAGADDEPVVVEYPPLLPRALFDRLEYVRNFPQLAALVAGFEGGAHEHRELTERFARGDDYDDLIRVGDLALAPACCYPVYPSLAGTLPDGGVTYEICTYCFRREPSVDPMRLQAFRQREHIRVGTAADVAVWSLAWIERSAQVFADLGLEARIEAASDPFFGRVGKMLAASQVEQALKLEMLVDVHGADHPTACGSLNDHQQRFGTLFDIVAADGSVASSGCIGIGLDRCAVALFLRWGTDVASWPAKLRERLWA